MGVVRLVSNHNCHIVAEGSIHGCHSWGAKKKKEITKRLRGRNIHCWKSKMERNGEKSRKKIHFMPYHIKYLWYRIKILWYCKNENLFNSSYVWRTCRKLFELWSPYEIPLSINFRWKRGHTNVFCYELDKLWRDSDPIISRVWAHQVPSRVVQSQLSP